MLYTFITLIVCMFWASSSEYYLREMITVFFSSWALLIIWKLIMQQQLFFMYFKVLYVYLKLIYFKVNCLRLDGHLNWEFGWNLGFVSLKWQIELFHRRRGNNICCCLHFSNIIKVLWRVKKGNVFFFFSFLRGKYKHQKELLFLSGEWQLWILIWTKTCENAHYSKSFPVYWKTCYEWDWWKGRGFIFNTAGDPTDLVMISSLKRVSSFSA